MQSKKFLIKSITQQEYNPLLDKYLATYFENKHVIKTLKRGRIINKKGEILDQHLQKQYVRFFSEFPTEQTPVRELQKLRERAKSVKIGKLQFSKHLNNTYLKKPQLMNIQ